MLPGGTLATTSDWLTLQLRRDIDIIITLITGYTVIIISHHSMIIVHASTGLAIIMKHTCVCVYNHLSTRQRLLACRFSYNKYIIITYI